LFQEQLKRNGGKYLVKSQTNYFIILGFK